MAKDIIQHHEQFDFDTFFKNISSRYINLDYEDFSNFLHTPGEKHSFIGCAEGKERLKDALNNALAAEDTAEIFDHASSVMITIIHSAENERPLSVQEIDCLNDFIARFSENCDMVWGIAEDSSLGNMIKIIVLVNTKG